MYILTNSWLLFHIAEHCRTPPLQKKNRKPILTRRHCFATYYSIKVVSLCSCSLKFLPAVPQWGSHYEPNVSCMLENPATYLALRGLISMYKCVCQELGNSRCSFPCKSHTGGLSQSVHHKQLGDKIPKIALGVFADKTTSLPPFGECVWHYLIPPVTTSHLHGTLGK